MSGSVLLELSGYMAHVTLCHAGKFNAMSRVMWRELRAVFEDLQKSSPGAVRCVVLQGANGHFCAGGDISEYANFRFEEASLRDFHENDVWGALQAMLDCDVPIVASIDGHCMGAGVEMASCCDLRLASTAARFGAPIARLGFPMAPREAALLVRAVGEMTAREMLLSAAVLDAAEMKQRGFLSRVCEASSLVEAVRDVSERLCSLAPAAARQNKQTFRSNPPLAAGSVDSHAIDSVAGLIVGAYRYADSAEHREGVNAFIDKRAPIF
ncbi:MAG: enoyl-CoA hydratase/isomerase family protein [Polaromonas sp.]|nr:enoyl-CoA hydratase/isomerase family protein [Polaromonas sp.]